MYFWTNHIFKWFSSIHKKLRDTPGHFTCQLRLGLTHSFLWDQFACWIHHFWPLPSNECQYISHKLQSAGPFLAYGFTHPPCFRPIHFTNKPSEAFGLRLTLIYFSLTYLLKDTVNKHICISHICIRFVRKRCEIEKIWFYKFVYHSIINIHLSAVILVNFFYYYSKMKREKYNRRVCSWT